jgi:enterochelin esterase-like enzyme
MNKNVIRWVIVLMPFVANAQADKSFSEIIKVFYTGSTEQKEKLWGDLINRSRIPLTKLDSVAFLYRGEANSVEWMGDFNGWGYDKNFNNKGERIPGTDIWILKTSFPKDARLDYKLVVDGKWMLDPHNPFQQWSGVGGGSPNSELRMPEWKAEPLRIPLPDVQPGNLKKDILISSKELGYQITYSVYLPFDFDKSQSNYPILYVTDGYEYLHEELGGMKTILDNLVGKNKIKPLIVVFVDNREPVYRSNNRRMQELSMNEKYLDFFTNELIPQVESQLGLVVKPEHRGILGTSMGGLTAAFFAFSKPEVFGLAGIQSPAFWLRPEIYTFCDSPDSPPLKIYLTTGLIHDTKDGTEKMKSILEKNTCTFQFKEVNQGHSWGNWKDLIDDILIYFFAPK